MEPIIVTGIAKEPLDVRVLVDRIRRDDCGGLAVFEGTTRTPDEGKVVEFLDYEAWEDKVPAQLDAIAREVAREYGLGGALAVHRVGRVMPSEPSVVVAASAPHRAEAFAAARALIDRVKAEAYVWKKEITDAGEAWVEPAGA
jgi:molybdopterin synthase catalytic subunit